MFLESLVFSSMRLGVPFIAPTQLGAVVDNLGRQFMPSVEWCTRHPMHHQTATVHVRCTISFQIRRIRPLLLRARWRTGQSGAPTDRLSSPHVARRLHGPPLALSTVGSPDSPVNYSHTTPLIPETGYFTVDQTGAPPDSPVCQARADTWLFTAKSFPMHSFFCWPCF
jgi:hypothetical protein